VRRESELEIAALADGQDMEGAVDTRGVPPAEMPRAYAAAVAAENLQSMAGTSRGPRVDVQWPPSTALMSLQLASCLKPGAALADALAFAGAFFFGEQAEELSQELHNRDLRVPSIDFLRHARVRLDVCNVMYQRQLSHEWFFVRHVMVDSSPQLGRNYLCVREDRVRFPRSLLYNFGSLATYDLDAAFETRVMPLSTLGHGEATALRKALNVSSIYMMETADDQGFDELRGEIKSLTTDQGAEAAINDLSVRVLRQYRGKFESTDPRCFLFPNCFHVPGHLHMLYNALSEACKNASISTSFF
jgi:hypothetical protein